MIVRLRQHQTEIEIESKPSLGVGGEGGVHKVIAPKIWKDYCVKLYLPQKRTVEREQKIHYLLQNPPIVDASGHPSIVWVKDIVYQKNNFIGYLMPLARDFSVEYLCGLKFDIHRLDNSDTKLQRFDRKHPDSLKVRLAVCFNIAAALAQLHHAEHYVLGDLKPTNIMFQSNAKISIIDFDSVQVHTPKVFYPAVAKTPEYTPPSFQGKNLEGSLLPPYFDVFGAAVIFYRILMGVHPFAGNNFKSPYQNVSDIPEAIKHKLFAHGKQKTYFSQIIPPHKAFLHLPKIVQDLFIQTFEGEQVSIFDWCEAFQGKKAFNYKFFPKLPHYPLEDISKDSLLLPLLPNPQLSTQYKDYSHITWVDINLTLLDKLQLTSKSKYKVEFHTKQEKVKECIKQYAQLKTKHSLAVAERQVELQKKVQDTQTKINQLVDDFEEQKKRYTALLTQTQTEFDKQLKQTLLQVLNKGLDMYPELKEMMAQHEIAHQNSTQSIQRLKEILPYWEEVNRYATQHQKAFEIAQKQWLKAWEKNYLQKQKQLVKEKTQLSQNSTFYLFSSSGLSQNAVNELQQAGFLTAMDVLAIDSKGRLQNTQQQWIKVPQIGIVRSKEILKWCRSCMKRLSNLQTPEEVQQQLIEIETYLTELELNFETTQRIVTQLNAQSYQTVTDKIAQEQTLFEQQNERVWTYLLATQNTTLSEIIKTVLANHANPAQNNWKMVQQEKQKNIDNLGKHIAQEIQALVPKKLETLTAYESTKIELEQQIEYYLNALKNILPHL